MKINRASDKLLWRMKETLKIVEAVFIASFLCVGVAQAQPYPVETVRQVMQRLSMLNYWTKTPTALLFKCGELYPDTARNAQIELIEWGRKNAKFNRTIHDTETKFKPVAVKMLERTPEQTEVLLTKIVDEEVTQKFVNAFSDKEAHALCRNFDKLLDAMLSDDLARPRVTLAEEELREKFSGLIAK